MDGTEALRALFRANLDRLNCSVIGKVTSIDKSTSKVSVQPLYRVFDEDDNLEDLPLLINVPLFQLMSSDYIIKVPTNVDDIVLIVFSDYDIQNLVLSGELRDVNTNDIHAYNDAIAIPLGLNPFTSQLGILNNNDLIIGKKDNSMFIKINDNGIEINSGPNDIDINTTGTGNVNIDCNLYNLTQRGV